MTQYESDANFGRQNRVALTYSFARSMLMTSSAVITPVSAPVSSSTTGRVEQIVLIENFGHFALVPSRD